MARPSERFTQTCQNDKCQKAFIGIPSRPGRYCSLACYNAARIGQPRGPYVERERRLCVVCDKEFLVGGRGEAGRGKQFCSMLCQQRGRYRRGKRAALLSLAARAYLAGIIDGEGSVMLYQRSVGSVTLRLAVTNCARELLEWIVKTTGVGVVVAAVPDTEKHRAVWQWHVNGDAAETTLHQIRRYLIVKGRQADLGLEFQKRLRTPKLKADYAWQVEWMARMKALNKRGPRAAEQADG